MEVEGKRNKEGKEAKIPGIYLSEEWKDKSACKGKDEESKWSDERK